MTQVWDSLLLYQKIAKKGPILSEQHNNYLNKIMAKQTVQTVAPAVKVAKLIYTLRVPEEFTIEHMNPNHILKANRGSGTLLDLKTVKSVEEVHSYMNSWIQKLKLFKNIHPEFFIEEKIHDAVLGKTGNAVDYKFFCFHGKPAFFLCRFDGNRNFYDLDFKPIKLQGGKQLPPIDLEPMLKIAGQLSAPFPFVRIDLYKGIDGVYFGEYTFHANAGCREFNYTLERRLGKLWT